MLLSLSVRDFVLIDRLDLSFRQGLCVMTGETGAGKSILLDALGLVLGARADAAFVRHGRDQAIITAAFDIGDHASARAALADQGFEPEDTVILRRTLGSDGRSRAFVNDQPASISFLRQLGGMLAEIQVQNDGHRLLQPANHRAVLDGFGKLEAKLAATRAAHDAWSSVRRDLAAAEEAVKKAGADEDYLRHALDEFAQVDPRPGEEAALAGERELLRHGERIAEALKEADSSLNARDGIESRLRVAERTLLRVAAQAAGRLDAVIHAVQRASSEAGEAVAALERARRDLDFDPRRLEQSEERLFALRALARKHHRAVDELPGLRDEMAARLALIDTGSKQLAALEKAVKTTRAAYQAAAEDLSGGRQASAGKLDKAVARELGPLKLEKARFRTAVEAVAEESAWTRDGLDRVQFEAATNPGQPFAPLAKVASGGELSRFMLALQVVLAGKGTAGTLVFDEADSGVGGATAAAIGERLARLAADVQVLVVTHSPQVAARGTHHWRIAKGEAGTGKKEVVADVVELAPADRREEIARMLAGSKVTDEARAAADSLMKSSAA